MFSLIEKTFIGLFTGLVNGSNHTNVYGYVIKNVTLNLLLLVYILIDAIKNFINIHLQLNKTDVLEVLINVMLYLI